jgi:hypothetical protein
MEHGNRHMPSDLRASRIALGVKRDFGRQLESDVVGPAVAMRLQLLQALGLPAQHLICRAFEGLREPHQVAAVGIARDEVEIRKPAATALAAVSSVAAGS